MSDLVEEENREGEAGESGDAGEEIGRRSGHVSLLRQHHGNGRPDPELVAWLVLFE